MAKARKKIFSNIELTGIFKNLNIENLTDDPSNPLPGRIWFNSNENVFKAAANSSVISMATREDIISLLNILKNTADKQGADIIGTKKISSSNGDLSIDAGNVTTTLQALLDYIDSNLQEINKIKDGTTVVPKAGDADTVDGKHASVFAEKIGSSDIEITDATKGIILTDRKDSSKKYRLYIEDGILGIEGV